MSKEVPLQGDLFTGELVDNRTRTQKRRDKLKQAPRQGELFSQREMAQFGVNPRPQIPLSPHTSLVLQQEDPRTPEQKAADEWRAMTEQMEHLFPDKEAQLDSPEPQVKDPSHHE